MIGSGVQEPPVLASHGQRLIFGHRKSSTGSKQLKISHGVKLWLINCRVYTTLWSFYSIQNGARRADVSSHGWCGNWTSLMLDRLNQLPRVVYELQSLVESSATEQPVSIFIAISSRGRGVNRRECLGPSFPPSNYQKYH